MFIQTESTPNPNSLKFLPGQIVSKIGPYEFKEKNNINNSLIRNIFAINGVTSIFLGEDFISVNKYDEFEWEDLKHIIISFINDYFANGNENVISKARGKWIQKEIGALKTWVIASFHPAFLMRQPEQKKFAWIDLKMIRDKSKNLKI